MKPKIDYTLYLVTDRALMSTQNLETAVEQAIIGGCTLIQLREKDISSADFYNLGLRVKAITDKYNIPLIINDRADIALAIDAAGVHVGQSDLSCAVARKTVGENKIVGVSVSSLAEAQKAMADGADYIGIGAMFATDTKTDAEIVSRDELIKIVDGVPIPCVVIGGINQKTLPFFDGINIDGISVISAIISQSDIAAAASNIKRLFTAKRRSIIRDIKAAIFDLDGTLLDSMGVWEKIDIEFLKKRGCEIPSFYLTKVCALSFKEAAEYTIKLFNLNDTVEDLLNEWDMLAIGEYTNNIRLKPYAKDYLMALKSKGIRLAVATSLPKKLYEPVLKNNGIFDLFEFCCSVDEVERGKEYPDIFELAIKRLNLNSTECMVFEDLLATVKSAKMTGAYVCGVYDNASDSQTIDIQKAADYFIKDFLTAPIILD